MRFTGINEPANPVSNKWCVGRQFANGDVTTNDAASAPRQAVLVAQPECAPRANSNA